MYLETRLPLIIVTLELLIGAFRGFIICWDQMKSVSFYKHRLSPDLLYDDPKLLSIRRTGNFNRCFDRLG